MPIDTLVAFFSNTWNLVIALFFFGASIFIHELGHFLAARKRGLQVDRFSIGFGPRLFGWKKDGVDYRISLLPLGGYVALPQLADMGRIEGGESEEDVKRLPPISFTDKVVVAVAGPIFNILFAFCIAFLVWIVGHPTSEETESTLVGHVPETLMLDRETEVPGPAFEGGLQPGDMIKRVDGQRVRNFRTLQQAIITGSDVDESGNPRTTLLVQREGEEIELTILPRLVEVNPVSGDRLRQIGMQPGYTVVVGAVHPDSPAELAGLRQGDLIHIADGVQLFSLNTLTQIINRREGEPVLLDLERDGERIELAVSPQTIAYRRPLLHLQWLGESQPGSVDFTAFYEDVSQVDPTDFATPATVRVHDTDRLGGSPLRRVRAGDTLTTINSNPVTSLASLKSVLESDSPDTVETLTLGFLRNGGDFEIEVPIAMLAIGQTPAQTQNFIGFSIGSRRIIVHHNPLQQFQEKIQTTVAILGGLISPTSDISIQHLSGPPGIVRVLHEFSSIDLRLLLWFVVLLNINLAILNLLPIPVLDGGHIVFATITKIRGKALPISLIGSIQGVFMILLFSLIIYVSFFDVRRWQGDADFDRQMRLEQELRLETVFRTE